MKLIRKDEVKNISKLRDTIRKYESEKATKVKSFGLEQEAWLWKG